MARKKTKMVYITDDVTRRRTFAKRKRCLLKKVYELSVLCDVPACALVTAPGEPNNQPEIWPSIFDADNLIGRLRDLPASTRDKHDLDQERFLSKEVERLREQLGRLEKGNREAEAKVARMRCLCGEDVQGGADFGGLGSLVEEEKTSAVVERIECLNGLSYLASRPVSDDNVHVELPVVTEEAVDAQPMMADGLVNNMLGGGGDVYDNKNDDWLYFSFDFNSCDNLSSVFNDFGPLFR
ncbi:Agamous-like MADS-box protein AGL80 [Acorus gramineus]|uniref:Agamous-like MADS-box protein AGL80 n=2 Tax=Acorus gramineus TaxID=55184 RepID=A0AAV9BLU6_ACOGR|nr:Agamous-like MADS-box protein AGL80 [Acorus gramineus]